MSQWRSKKKRSPWLLAVKICCWVVGCLAVIAGAIIAGFAIYFNPSRIAHLIEEKSPQYLDARINIGQLHYKVFGSYPWLEFRVDSLDVISHSLNGLSPDVRQELPVFADSLASVLKLSGKINVKDLFHHKIRLKDIEAVCPEVNIVMVNDSLTNFNIAPSIHKPKKMPKIDVSEVNVVAPVTFNFFSLADDVSLNLDVEDFYLADAPSHSYSIGFQGMMAGRYKDWELPGEIPVAFHTQVTPHFPEMTLDLKNLSVSYSGLKLEVEGDVKADKDKLDLKSLGINLTIADVFDLLNYLPAKAKSEVVLPPGLSGNLPLALDIKLNRPWSLQIPMQSQLSMQDLPPLEARIKIDDANLLLAPPKRKKIVADDVYLDAVLNFDPTDSVATSFSLQELRMHGEGISLDCSANISNLTGVRQDFSSEIKFGSPLVESLAYFMPKSALKIAGYLKGDVKVEGTAMNFGKEGVKNIRLNGDIASGSLKVNSPAVGNVRVKKLKTDFKAIVPNYPFQNNYAGLKLDLDIKADTLASKSQVAEVILGKLDFNLDAMDTVSGSPDPFGDLVLKAGQLAVKAQGNELNAKTLAVKAKGMLNASPPAPNSPAVSPYSPGDDELIAQKVGHTPLVVEYSGGGIMQTVMSMLQLDADVMVASADFKTPDYLYPVEIKGLDLSTNLNKLNLRAKDITIANSSLKINSEVDGLMPFITTYSPTLLNIDADINFKNVDINQLAWGYYATEIAKGKSPDSVFYVPPMTPFTAADSVCVAIPRNINANLRLFSDSAQYMQYKFAPLSTDIIVKNGAATLSKLTVGTPYCSAIVDWTYSTSLLSDIYMDLKARLVDFRFQPFYKVFPSLVEKASQLNNLSGEINADISCRFGMFPSMFMNSESLAGRFNVKGSDLEFQRTGRIEKITHLMLIEGDEPIHLQNLDISGFYHDNLLQVNPFKVDFDSYELEFGGINNTAGDMYYHIALLKSPFHMPFGVTLKGKFSHPEVRLGGTRMDNKEAESVAADLTSKIDVNIMTYLHHGWLLFIQEAAKYEGGLAK